MSEISQTLKQALSYVQKPGRYTGGEPGSTYKDPAAVDVRMAFCFPDTYEIGMSFLGMKILYELLNDHPNWWCERCFMPWADMKQQMDRLGIPLYCLESKDPLTDMDIVGFSLEYELCYTNVLAMLRLAGIPLRSADRDGRWPLVIAGGPCVCNAEPVADFFDVMQLGEGEEMLQSICATVEAAKKQAWSKQRLLAQLACIPGVYVPSFYDVTYEPNGCIRAVTPNRAGVPARVTKAIVRDLDAIPPPRNFVTPMVGAVQDRACVEVLRGCTRGCRFCQAGQIYRPFRERSAHVISEGARTLCENTGYDELSLSSLSTSDHSHLEEILDEVNSWAQEQHVSLSLPSLRMDNFSASMAEKTTLVRKSGLTFAAEAGTQRLRDVINKNVTWEQIERTCRIAFQEGYTAVKLYFMIGLPTETMEDIKGIADTCQNVVDLYYHCDHPKGKSVQVTASVASFVPKPHTPFEFCAQDRREVLQEKQKYLVSCVHSRKIRIRYHDSAVSVLEGILAKGDRRLSKVIETAFENGAFLDTWEEYFDFSRWQAAFAACGLDPDFYHYRTLDPTETTPWDHMDVGVRKEFLLREYKKAMQGAVTLPCHQRCSACGADKLLGRPCFDYGSHLL